MNAGWLLRTNAPRATILIRLIVGAVFLSEGIQKFVYPDDLGPGRFARIGFSNPDLLANMVGAVEITAGVLILLGLRAAERCARFNPPFRPTASRGGRSAPSRRPGNA